MHRTSSVGHKNKMPLCSLLLPLLCVILISSFPLSLPLALLPQLTRRVIKARAKKDVMVMLMPSAWIGLPLLNTLHQEEVFINCSSKVGRLGQPRNTSSFGIYLAVVKKWRKMTSSGHKRRCSGCSVAARSKEAMRRWIIFIHQRNQP